MEHDPATLMQCAYSLYFVPILLQCMAQCGPFHSAPAATLPNLVPSVLLST